MKCGDCGQEILQAHPEICPYCKSKKLISEEDTSKELHGIDKLLKAGQYEEAALGYEKLELWDKAKESRRLARKKHIIPKNLQNGQVGAISIKCPHCNALKQLSSKSHEEVCNRCGTTYKVPGNVLALLTFDEKS